MEGWFQILQFVQSIVVGLAGVFAWMWNRQHKAELALSAERFRRLTERQRAYEEEFDRRVEHINKQLSTRLSPSVQSLIARVDRMPDELRSKFLPLDRAMDLVEESRRDRAALWNEIQKSGGRGHPR